MKSKYCCARPPLLTSITPSLPFYGILNYSCRQGGERKSLKSLLETVSKLFKREGREGKESEGERKRDRRSTPVPPREGKSTVREGTQLLVLISHSHFRGPFWERWSIKGNNLLSESGTWGREGEEQNITGLMFWAHCRLRTQELSEGVTPCRQTFIWGHLTQHKDCLMSQSWKISHSFRSLWWPHLKSQWYFMWFFHYTSWPTCTRSTGL